PPTTTPFPYTTLFRSRHRDGGEAERTADRPQEALVAQRVQKAVEPGERRVPPRAARDPPGEERQVDEQQGVREQEQREQSLDGRSEEHTSELQSPDHL